MNNGRTAGHGETKVRMEMVVVIDVQDGIEYPTRWVPTDQPGRGFPHEAVKLAIDWDSPIKLEDCG